MTLTYRHLPLKFLFFCLYFSCLTLVKSPCNFVVFFPLRLLQLFLETDRMWLRNVVALCLLALAASAEDKKLSSHATTLADNSANLAFRSVTLTLR